MYNYEHYEQDILTGFSGKSSNLQHNKIINQYGNGDLEELLNYFKFAELSH